MVGEVDGTTVSYTFPLADLPPLLSSEGAYNIASPCLPPGRLRLMAGRWWRG